MGWSRETITKVAKRTGYPVVAAWSSHNAGTMGTIYGPMLHHTGSAKSKADYVTLKVVRDGRPGLENSLCMYGLGKSGTIYLINDKISWHAGVGSWQGTTDGNGHFAGIEAESSGANGDWTAEQLDCYPKLVASILLETGRDTNWMPMHKEWALPKGRKSDPSGLDTVNFKKQVQKYLANPGSLGVPGGGEDWLMALNDAQQVELYQNMIATRSMLNNVHAWIRGGDPNVDNITLLWMGQNNMTSKLVELRALLVGGNPEGRNNFDWVVQEITAAIKNLPGAKVDEVALAKAIAESVKFTPESIAQAVNDEADRRNRDNNSDTGDVS